MDVVDARMLVVVDGDFDVDDGWTWDASETEVVCSRFDFLDALGLEALLAAPVQHLVLLVHEWSTFSVDIFDIVGAIVDELVHHFLKVRDTYCFEQSFRWSCSVEADAVLIVVVVALLS